MSDSKNNKKALKKVRETIAKKKSSRVHWENYFQPETAIESLEDSRLRREMIRRAAKYMIQKCHEEDQQKEAEIKQRGDEKEIEAWFNQPRHHD